LQYSAGGFSTIQQKTSHSLTAITWTSKPLSWHWKKGLVFGT